MGFGQSLESKCYLVVIVKNKVECPHRNLFAQGEHFSIFVQFEVIFEFVKSCDQEVIVENSTPVQPLVDSIVPLLVDG